MELSIKPGIKSPTKSLQSRKLDLITRTKGSPPLLSGKYPSSKNLTTLTLSIWSRSFQLKTSLTSSSSMWTATWKNILRASTLTRSKSKASFISYFCRSSIATLGESFTGIWNLRTFWSTDRVWASS